ncbi:MAG TPA: hypothetical protein VMT19_04100 [Thermoanaerobaculaceae bacterium]|nr:hypothetical protein [Thermoanaerobaculaceae bacterium]
MTYRTLLVAKAAVALFFGAQLLLAPVPVFGLMGVQLGAAGSFPAREYAAAMLGIMVLTWLAKDVKAPDARGAILVQLLAYDGIGVVITLHALATRLLNPLGWGIVAVYLFFTAGSAWVLAKKHPFRRPSAQPVA